MKTDQIEQLIRMNHRLSLVLGFATSFIFDTQPENRNHPQYKWIIEAIENLLYLNKPLPPMP